MDTYRAKIAYFAPEIWLEGYFSRYSDLFALGAVFYRSLTGKMPFQFDQLLPPNVLHQISSIVPPHELRNEIPALISDRKMQLLAINVDERQHLVDIILDELRQLV